MISGIVLDTANYYSHYAYSLDNSSRRSALLAVDKASDVSVRSIEDAEPSLLQKQWSKQEAFDRIESLFTNVQSFLTNAHSFNPQPELARLRKIIDIKKLSFNEQTPALHICELIKQIFFQWLDETFLACETSTNRGAFYFTEADYHHANFVSIKSSNQILMCSHFAFYKLNENWAQNYLFADSIVLWPSELHDDPCGFFCNRGYALTNRPVEGDLVVYCAVSSKAREPRHYGIWTKSEKVLSKHGNLSVYEHDLNEVDSYIGNTIYFFHKDIKTSLQLIF